MFRAYSDGLRLISDAANRMDTGRARSIMQMDSRRAPCVMRMDSGRSRSIMRMESGRSRCIYPNGTALRRSIFADEGRYSCTVIPLRFSSLLLCLAACALFAARAAVPSLAQDVLRNAHAHNDYEHPRPLFDALDHGFLSIEADIHLVDDSLFVAHDPEDVQTGRTLERLYLAPLRERIRHNGGSVYGDGSSLLLLVDIKTEAEATYLALRRVLGRYSDVLTRFAGDRAFDGPVTVVVSGNRPRETMRRQAVRFAAYDGRLDDLERHAADPSAFIPLVSSSWADVSQWRGDGPAPDSVRVRLRDLVERAHSQGRRLRFWATADTPSVWRELRAAGVDLIGTDDLGALKQFLSDRP